MRTTHQVQNQSSVLSSYNLFEQNLALREAALALGANCDLSWLSTRGAEMTGPQHLDWATRANTNSPQLMSFDSKGFRRDEVIYDETYHHGLDYIVRHGMCAKPWQAPAPGAHVQRGAFFSMAAQIESGRLCPATMTYAVVAALQCAPQLAEPWLAKIMSASYDARFIPASEKSGVLFGMGMTEKQGGSDVRANSTRAIPVGGGEYRIIGHKWFFSAPQSDAFLILAYVDERLSCFLLPRFVADGQLNAIRIQRLKDKLGDRSNASSEVEFHEASAYLLGEEGAGIASILQMGNLCRVDCALGSAGLMREAYSQAVHHASYRQAFGKRLLAQPLMMNVLADMALEVEAAHWLSMYVASLLDSANEAEQLICRVLVPTAKYWICKRGPMLAAEAMEVLGGNGYVEDGSLAKVYRQMPLNSIWEGSGNIMCLDVMRALGRDRRCAEAVLAELGKSRHRHQAYQAELEKLAVQLTDVSLSPAAGRAFGNRLALLFQAHLLLQYAPDFVAEAFCQSRLNGASMALFGALPTLLPLAQLIERSWPKQI